MYSLVDVFPQILLIDSMPYFTNDRNNEPHPNANRFCGDGLTALSQIESLVVCLDIASLWISFERE